MRLAYGAVQRRDTLDHVIAELSDRPPEKLDEPVLDALRLGIFQLCFLDGVADHAAVSQSVDLVDGPGRGLVNAVLRRAAREAPALVAGLPDSTPEEAALKHSHPAWIARLWWDAFGPDGARSLMAADNEPAETAVRVNTLVTQPQQVAQELGTNERGQSPFVQLPEALVLDGPYDVAGSAAFREGRLTPQSRASMLVARTLAPEPGERVLDLCAAPGAKATHLAALMENEGEVVAVEKDPNRASELRDTAARLHAGIVRVVEGDARDDHGEGFDRVLVDPPCSGLGTLRGRPDLRWRTSPERATELAALQKEILAAAERAVRPGGEVVYSTCTLNPAENEDVVSLWKHDPVAPHLLLRPDRDGTDGFFIARLRRAA
jgi:16S rRNA (cytosine967-C5)-methyltransferase